MDDRDSIKISIPVPWARDTAHIHAIGIRAVALGAVVAVVACLVIAYALT